MAMEDDQRVSPPHITEEGDRQIQPEVDSMSCIEYYALGILQL